MENENQCDGCGEDSGVNEYCDSCADNWQWEEEMANKPTYPICEFHGELEPSPYDGTYSEE